MMTFAEVKAIEAESRFLINDGSYTSKGTTAETYAAYLAIPTANMKKLEVTDADAATYLTSTAVNVGAAQLTLLNILREKYKAMFLIGDIWTDVRKYDYWDFPVPSNVNVELGGKRIQRMKYPSSELTRNSANAEQNQKLPVTPMWYLSK